MPFSCIHLLKRKTYYIELVIRVKPENTIQLLCYNHSPVAAVVVVTVVVVVVVEDVVVDVVVVDVIEAVVLIWVVEDAVVVDIAVE